MCLSMCDCECGCGCGCGYSVRSMMSMAVGC